MEEGLRHGKEEQSEGHEAVCKTYKRDKRLIWERRKRSGDKGCPTL